MSKIHRNQRIGVGGMAEVFLGLQEGIGNFEKLVVIKRILPQFSQVEEFAALFLQEARVAASLQHPHIVSVLDVGSDEEGLFSVLEYVAGVTLEAISNAQQRHQCPTMPWQLACRIGADIADALHYAHTSASPTGTARQVIHRDVSPSNILLGYDGRAALLDFGIARSTIGAPAESYGLGVGKIGYQAPEQIANITEGPASDVFQLASVIHELVTGSCLIDARDEHSAMIALLEQPLPKAKELVPEIPDELDALLSSALAIDWDSRTQSADELRQGLELLIAGAAGASRSDVGEWLAANFQQQKREQEKLAAACRAAVPGANSLDTTTSALTPLPPASVAPASVAPAVANSRRSYALALVLLLLVGAGGLFVYRSAGSARVAQQEPGPATVDLGALDASAPEAQQSLRIAITTTPPSSEIYVDGELVAVGMYQGQVAKSQRHHIRVAASGFIEKSFSFQGEALSEHVELDPSPKEQKPAIASTVPENRVRKTRPKTKKPRPSSVESASSVTREMGTDNVDPWAKPD